MEGVETKKSELGMEVTSCAKQKVGSRERCPSTEGMALVARVEALGFKAREIGGRGCSPSAGIMGGAGGCR